MKDVLKIRIWVFNMTKQVEIRGGIALQGTAIHKMLGGGSMWGQLQVLQLLSVAVKKNQSTNVWLPEPEGAIENE